MNIPAWLAKWRVTSDWAAHRARGSLGGVDWATPTGTPIYAPSDGIADFRFYGDGSSVIRIRRADNTRTEFLHGTFLGGNFRPVKAGERVGTSDGRRGTRGAGSSTGPHVHAHDVTAAGVRVPPFSTIPNSADLPDPPTKGDTVTLYYCTDTDKPSVNGSRQPIKEWALAGEAPGTSANWLTTTSQSVVDAWAAQHGGNWCFLIQRSYDSFRDRYLEPLTISGGGTTGPTAEQISAEVIRQQKLPGN